jgi:glutathione S-transferase
MLRIWGRTSSLNVQKVMWTVAELGLEHERIDAGGAFGKLDTPAYGRLNPNRRIPTIEDGDVVVWESNACVRYLAARYGAGSLWPEAPGQRARSDMWMDWAVTTVMPELGPAFMQLVRTPAGKRDMAVVAAAAARLGPVFALLDDHLAHSPYVGGEALTIGDIPLGCAFWRYQNLDLERPPLPNCQLWYQSLKARDAYRRHVMLPLT